MVANPQQIIQRVNRLLSNNSLGNQKSGEYWKRYTTQSAPIDYRDPLSDILLTQTGKQGNKPVTDIRVKNAYEREIVDNRVNMVFGKRFGMTLAEGESPRLQRFYDRNTLGVLAKEIMRNSGACGYSAVMLYQPLSDDAYDVALMPLKPYEYCLQYDSQGTPIYGLRIYTEVIDPQSGAAQIVEPNATPKAATQADQSGERVRIVCEYWDAEQRAIVEGYRSFSDTEAALRDTYVTEYKPQGSSRKAPAYGMRADSTTVNNFGAVPFVEFRGLEGNRPYYFPALSLIDAYNILFSDAASEFAAFRSAYLILKNWVIDDQLDDDGNIQYTKEQIIKRMRTFFFDENGDAKFLTREIPTAAFVEFERIFRHNIDRFSQNVDFTDPEVYGTATNLAISTRLKGAENAANDCADQFEVSMKRVIDVCNGLWAAGGQQIDPWSIKFEFPYDRPGNINEEANTIATLTAAGVTLEDALRTASFVDNPAEWAERAAAEKKELIGQMSAFDIKPDEAEDDDDEGDDPDGETVE
jgi:hypothetical protein